MKIGIFTYGSRGDIQPYVALAVGLINNGHNVILAAPENFKKTIEDYGIAFHPIVGNVEELLDSEKGQKIVATGQNLKLLRLFAEESYRLRVPLRNDVLKCCQKVDVMITNNMTTLIVATIAEKYGKKWAMVQLNPPLVKTRAFPAPGIEFLKFSIFNKWSYNLMEWIFWRMNKKEVQEFRQVLGLPKARESTLDTIAKNKILTIHAFSQHLLSRPQDWPDQNVITGFLFAPRLEETKKSPDSIPDELHQWLEAGDKPIYIGFGSIPFPDMDLLRQIIENLIQDRRVIFCLGWSKMTSIPNHENLFVTQYVNHEWLFPRCKMAIIHGGIGTLASVLKSKIPVIVVSIFADQPWWGAIVENKGLGFHIPSKKLSIKRLKNLF